MKNPKLQTFSFVLLVLFSLCSYIFLNTTDLSEERTAVEKSSLQVTEPSQNAEQEVMLPDVKAVKVLMEKGIRLLPAS